MTVDEHFNENKPNHLWSTLENLCSMISVEMTDAIYAGEAAPWWRVDRTTLVPNPLSMISEHDVEEAISDSVGTSLRLLSQSFLTDILSEADCPEPEQWIKTAFMPLLLEVTPIALEVELMREILRPLPNCILSVDFASRKPPASVTESISPQLGQSKILPISSETQMGPAQAPTGNTPSVEETPMNLQRRPLREQTYLSSTTLIRAAYAIFEKLLKNRQLEKTDTTLITELACPATFRVPLKRIFPNIIFSLGSGPVLPGHRDNSRPLTRSELLKIDDSLLSRVVKSALKQLPISLIERLPESLDLVSQCCPVNNDLVVIGFDLSERTLIAVANASSRGRAVVFCQHGFPYEFLDQQTTVASLELTGKHLNSTSRREFVSWNHRQGIGGTGSLRLASMEKSGKGRVREGRFYLEARVPPHRSASLISARASFLERHPAQGDSRSAHVDDSKTGLQPLTVWGEDCGFTRVPHPAGRRYNLNFPNGPGVLHPNPLLGRKLIPSAELVVFEGFSTGVAEALYYQTPFSIYCPAEWYTVRSENEQLRSLLAACAMLVSAWEDVEALLNLSSKELESWHRSSAVQIARDFLAEQVVGPPFSVRGFANAVKNALSTPHVL